MAEAEIYLDRDSANDESGSVIKVHCASGSLVVQGQLLFEIENSKATQEIEAPIEGAVVHALTEGDEVELGLPIALIVPIERVAHTQPPDARRRKGPTPAAEQRPSRKTPGPSRGAGVAASRIGEQSVVAVTRRRPADRGPRFSKAAAALLAATPIDSSRFEMEFVTAADVRAVSRAGEPSARGDVARPAHGSPGGAALSARKRAEIRSLESGAGSSLLSVLSVNVGVALPRSALGGSEDAGIADLVIYEASRLMRRYERLNSYYADGDIIGHAQINAGIAIDTGGRLVVYGIQNSDQLELVELRANIDDAVARYLDNTLSGAEMSRATFSVTDLSAEPLDFVLPLLPAGQCCIIGVTRNADGEFALHLGFDHRITEGREVAQFLGELRTRIQSFRNSTAAAGGSCFFCERTVQEEVRDFNGKGLLRMTNADGLEVLCCAACFNGW